jgi:hypothetical protein
MSGTNVRDGAPLGKGSPRRWRFTASGVFRNVAASAALRVRGLVPLASAVTLLGGAAAAGRDLLAFGGCAVRAGAAS